MKAYKHLIRHAIAAGHTVSVWDGEEWQVKRSTAYKAIVEAVESVDEATLRILSRDGGIIGTALVSAYGLADDETVMNYGVNPFMEAWNDAYDATLAH